MSGREKNKNGQEEVFEEMEINFPELKKKNNSFIYVISNKSDN